MGEEGGEKMRLERRGGREERRKGRRKDRGEKMKGWEKRGMRRKLIR